MVASNVSRGCSARIAATMRRAWVGPLKKSGSPNEMCSAPAATCCRTSARTTSRGTIRKRPSYTGTMGQWRQRCLQPRLASAKPTVRFPPSGSSSFAYWSSGGRPLRSGTRKSILPRWTPRAGSSCGPSARRVASFCRRSPAPGAAAPFRFSPGPLLGEGAGVRSLVPGTAASSWLASHESPIPYPRFRAARDPASGICFRCGVESPPAAPAACSRAPLRALALVWAPVVAWARAPERPGRQPGSGPLPRPSP